MKSFFGLMLFLSTSVYSSGVSDSALDFWSYFGGGQGDSISFVTHDSSGRIYLVGWTDSMNLPANGFQTERAGEKDVFVARIGSDGQNLDFLTYLGGTGDEQPNHIYVDSSGNCYVTGFTTSRDFPLQDPYQSDYGGGTSDGFIFKLSSNGKNLLYSTYLGGEREDIGSRILGVDPVLIAGRTQSNNFPLLNSLQEEIAGRTDSFVTRLNSSGMEIEASTLLGGERDDYLYAALLDTENRTVLLGNTSSKEYPLENPIQEELKGSNDLFVSILNSDLDQIEFSTYLGGKSSETPYTLLLDPEGLLILAGDTASSDFPLELPIQAELAGSSDIFITVISADRTELSASTFLGGSGFDSIRGMGLDEAGNLIFSGVTTSSDFPEVGGVAERRENAEMVLGAINLAQGRLISTTYLGGNRVDLPTGAFFRNQTLYVAGVTDSTDMPTENAYQKESGGKGIYLSNAGTDDWMPSGNGITDFNIDSIHLLRKGAKTLVFAGTSSSGVFKSEDGGSSWSSIGPEETQVLSIAVDPNDTDIIYIGTSNSLLKTEDGGEEWEPVNEGLPGSSFPVLQMDPQESQTLYTGTPSRGIFKTTNGGERWRAINAGLDDFGKQVFSIAVNPQNSEEIYLGTNGTVYRSTNGGSTWSETIFTQVGPVRALAIDPSQPDTVYASGFNSAIGDIVGKTEKDGQGNIIWRALPIEGTVADLAIDPQKSTTVYAATFEDGVFKSPDQGTTWLQINNGLGTSKVTSIAVDPRIMSRVFAATQSGSDGFFLAFQQPRVFYFPQVADGGQGRVQFQTLIMLLNTGDDSEVTIDFYDPEGNPLEMALGSRPSSSRHVLELQRGAGFVGETPGEGDLKVGYAHVTGGSGIDGTVIFRRTDRYSKLVLYEAGVPMTQASGDFVFLLDSLGDKDTGVVLVNPLEGTSSRPEQTEVELTLYDEDSNLIEDTILHLAQGEHNAKFIAELFPEIQEQASEMQGLITAVSDFPLLGLTLRQRDSPISYPQEVSTLAPFPVMTSNNGGSTIYFPQIGDGEFLTERFRTTFILANSGTSFSVVEIEFFDSNGEPMELDLGTGTGETSRSFFLPPKKFEFIQTTGEGEAKVGYAKVSSSNFSVGGVGVFTQIDSSRDMIMTEAGVPATIPVQKFSLFLDSVGQQDTGLAMVNPSGDQEANLTIKLYDLESNLIAENSISIAPGAHLPRFIRELLPEVKDQAANMQGIVTVISDLPIAAVTLKQRNDPDKVFPGKIPTLTTFPVIRGIAE